MINMFREKNVESVKIEAKLSIWIMKKIGGKNEIFTQAKADQFTNYKHS